MSMSVRSEPRQMTKVRSSSLKTCSLASLNGVSRRTYTPLFRPIAFICEKTFQKLRIPWAHVKAHGSLLQKLLKAGGIALFRSMLADPLDCSAVQLALRDNGWHMFSLVGLVGLVCRKAFRTRPPVGLQLETAWARALRLAA